MNLSSSKKDIVENNSVITYEIVVTEYCVQIRLLTDEELDYKNFNEAKILLESAFQYVSNNATYIKNY